jgi:hypothetical protein
MGDKNTAKLPKMPIQNFNDPVFDRIEWNKYALHVSYFCNKNKAKVCPELAKLYTSLMSQYSSLILQRKKERENRRQHPFKKMRKKKRK